MSASTKKKLRNAEHTEKLTERQIAAQKEAKKVKIYTTVFVIVTVILLAIALTICASQIIDKTGIRQKNSVAMTVGDVEITSPEMTYFYVDAVSNFYSTNSDIISYFLDTATPLNQQMYSYDNNTTWADYFLTIAQSNAEYAYTYCAAAEAEGHTLSEAELEEVASYTALLEQYALSYGVSDLETFLKGTYGEFATVESFNAYQEKIALANSYRSAYADSLTYDDAAIDAAVAADPDKYASFTYHSYLITTNRFLSGGTVGADGTTTYTDEEKAAALAAAEEAAKSVVDSAPASIEAFDAAIAGLSFNAESTGTTSVENANVLYTSIDASRAAWLAQEHKTGDVAYVPYETTLNGETTVNGYYVLYFVSRNDNEFALPNVRHILISTEDDMEKAESILDEWKSGSATEESFGALALKYSIDTGSAEDGGMVAEVKPGTMVQSFEDWCYGEHQVGDTGIIESEYGFHIMYFSGYSDSIYLDLLVSEDLFNTEMERWYADLHAKYPVTIGTSKYLPLSMTLGG